MRLSKGEEAMFSEMQSWECEKMNGEWIDPEDGEGKQETGKLGELVRQANRIHLRSCSI